MMTKDWDIIITNKSKLLSIDLHEVWRYRDLLAMYVKRDIITFYKQTILGPLWFVIQPLFTTIMFMFVFGGIAGISTLYIHSIHSLIGHCNFQPNTAQLYGCYLTRWIKKQGHELTGQ